MKPPSPQAPVRAKAAPASSVAPARIAAAHVLLAVERGVAHSDDQLRSQRVEVLSRQDRDLTTELVRGVLRWQIVLDREIGARLRYPESDMHFGVIIALRLGAYQLLFLDRIPPHAAVNDSVELAKQADGQEIAGLVNAVLRRLLREKAELRSLRTDPAAAYPRWLVTRWIARFGDAGTQALCAFGQQPPPASIRLLGPLAEAVASGEQEQVARSPDVAEEKTQADPPRDEPVLEPEYPQGVHVPVTGSVAVLEPGAFLSNVRHVLKGDPAAISTPSRIQGRGLAAGGRDRCSWSRQRYS